MPLYEYQCGRCGRFELIRKFSDEPVTVCPTCGQEVQKLFSAPAIQFKGTGWYITDYARKSSGGESSKDGGAKPSGGEASKDGGAKSSSGGTDAGASNAGASKDGGGKSGSGESASSGSSETSPSTKTAKTGSSSSSG